VIDVATGFHSGELAVQQRAGVQGQTARLSPMVERGELSGGVAAFLVGTTFAALTARDRNGKLWTSPLIGPAGFLEAASPTKLVIGSSPHAHDPLQGLPSAQPAGLIVMDFARRRRLRINGMLSAVGDSSFEVDVVQAYGNCPQGIDPRRPAPVEPTLETRLIHRSDLLRPDDVEQIRAADTFFLGTTHPEFGNDASHRGGPAGFVRAEHDVVAWPDFPGNNMFNSLGNIEVDPDAALLFVDFRVRADGSVVWCGAGALAW
jgi:predicted pyridoxine 5'-phosphate oxidase superfamily flavin-nucleotide-binding protein